MDNVKTTQPSNTNKILQWNCRGIKPNLNELLILISLLNPAVICLQETFLQDENVFRTPNYEQYHYIHNAGLRANGGTSILIRKDIPQSNFPIQTNIQAIATRVTLHKTITICSIYLPPNKEINEKELENLIEQLPKPFILLGDFNSHNILWGCKQTNPKGNKIEHLINKNNLCLLNRKEQTYINPSNGSTSSIDLTLCDPTSFMDYTWNTYKDTCGSDHYPIIIDMNNNIQDHTPRWNINKADWIKFQHLCSKELIEDKIQTMEHYTQTLISIATKSIPKSSPSGKKNKPWFNSECKEIIKQRKAALKNFKKQPTTSNLLIYKQQRAKARKTIKESKRKCWQEFVQGMNISTKPKTVWKIIRKISGKQDPMPIKHLLAQNIKVTEKKAIANQLAETFSKNSSSKNYSKQFQTQKKNQEKYKINFNSENNEPYNETITLNELKSAIEKSHDSAVGPDEVHYSFLRQLPSKSLDLLLKLYNKIWINKIFPKTWEEATIIPIPKPGKDTSNPENYRPIALTSCLCKTFERIINNRLIWYLETNKLFSNSQCGYRKNRSCIDHITSLETFIREAFLQKQHVTTVFFDLEKAYDTTWRYGILQDLHNLGLRGRLPQFIKNFLTNRSFQVKIGSTKSEQKTQEEGVPQGSIISTTLFNIKINNITKELSDNTLDSLYVDDCSISYRAKNIHTLERKLQNNINKINEWAKENGFKFSKNKTKGIHFCSIHKLHNDPTLHIEGETIPFVKEYKHLGIIFDNKLNFIPHINYIKKKCSQTLQLLRVVAHTDWGANTNTLIKLYRTLIRSKTDYASFIYQSARKSYLKTIKTILHTGLRLALGAFPTSPVESLYIEANETPPELRCNNLGLKYYTKLKANPTNPAHNSTFNLNHKDLFQQKENAIKTYGLRMESIYKEADIPLTNIHKISTFKTPPWKIATPKLDQSLCKYEKKITHPLIFQEKFEKIKEKYPEHTHIYTDGSKLNNTTTSAAIINKTIQKTKHLPKEASIFSAEIYAIHLALDLISENKNSKYIIFSDSKSAIIAIKNKKTDNPLIENLLEKFNQMSNNHETILCWIPSHIGIHGNELADTTAKTAHSSPTDNNFKLPYTDLKRYINFYTKNKWQNTWNNSCNNKLHETKKEIGENPNLKITRKEEVILTRLRIGHTNITHSYLLKGEEPPHCIPCQEPYTIKHILSNCLDLQQTRKKHYTETELNKIFLPTNITNVFNYLKEVKIYNKI